MKLKNLFAITAIASALVLTGCKEEKKADAASTVPAPTSIRDLPMISLPSFRMIHLEAVEPTSIPKVKISLMMYLFPFNTDFLCLIFVSTMFWQIRAITSSPPIIIPQNQLKVAVKS